jgi:hypothetical protein
MEMEEGRRKNGYIFICGELTRKKVKSGRGREETIIINNQLSPQ